VKHPILIAVAFRRRCKKFEPLRIPDSVVEAALRYGITIKKGDKNDRINKRS
jgi:hypothetical protein